MTISASATYRTLLTADGVLTEFDFTFPLLDSADLDVYLIDTDGVAVLQNSGYSVDVDPDNVGGTVTFSVAPTDQYQVLMVPNLAYSQDTALPTNEGISEEQVERMGDRAVLLIRQLKDIVDRCVKLDITSELDDLTIPAPTANAILGWNADGDALENKVLGDLDTDLSVAIASGDAKKIVRVNTGETALELASVTSIVGGLSAISPLALTDKILCTDTSDSNNAKSATIIDILKLVFPVGALFHSGVATNPATLFGFGTWTAIEGRTIVGKAASGTFSTLDATMGAETHTLLEAEMPAHTHPNGAGSLGGSGATGYFAGSSGTVQSGSAGGGGAHNNIQPSIVKYIWQRTA